MIDTEKWENASREQKLNAIKVIKTIMNDNTLTKADNALMTDFLLEEVSENE